MNPARVRPTGVVARLGAGSAAVVTAESGAVVPLAFSPSMAGFNPLELLDAALAGCLAISLKVAAGQLGLAGRLRETRVEVRGEKAPGQPSRIARQVCRFAIAGDLTADERQRLMAQAHALCTVGHTLAGGVEIVDGPPLD